MKKFIVLTFALLITAFTSQIFAQDMAAKGHKAEMSMKKEMKKEMKAAPKTIKLSQTTGEFNIEGLTLSEGTYVFEISNEDVDHAVGFVLAPKGKTDQANHIKEAYVQKTPEKGETSQSKVVTLTPGEYVYFCPLNPTPQYTITVK